MRLRYDYIIREIADMALHKQTKKKKQYEANWTLYPGCREKFLIHYEKDKKCYRVTHYSMFGERGKILRTVAKTDPNGPWRRRSWTYQRDFENEVDAMSFAKNKATERKFSDPVFLLQLDL